MFCLSHILRVTAGTALSLQSPSHSRHYTVQSDNADPSISLSIHGTSFFVDSTLQRNLLPPSCSWTWRQHIGTHLHDVMTEKTTTCAHSCVYIAGRCCGAVWCKQPSNKSCTCVQQARAHHCVPPAYSITGLDRYVPGLVRYAVVVENGSRGNLMALGGEKKPT